jgi:ankyrin repeat protein
MKPITAEELLEAAAKGKLAKVQKLLQLGVSVNVTGGRQSRTALHHAAAGGRQQVVQHLVDAGADLGACTTLGSTAMHLAAQGGHAPVAVLLLSKGASHSAVDSKGQSPLHVAARCGSTAMIKVLLDAGASLDAADSLGWTPLHWASSCGKQEAAAQLLAAGAAVDAVDSKGCTPLHLACSKGHMAVLRVLVAAGAPLDARDGEGKTPLLTASESGQAAVVAELLGGAGVQAMIKDNAGRSALHAASSSSNRMAVLEALLQAAQVRAQVDALTDAGHTALQLVCRGGHAEAAKLLLAAGADPNAMGGGKTPLHEALERRDVSCLEALLAAGADADRQYGAGAVATNGASLQGLMPLQRAHQLYNYAAVLCLVTPENLRHLSEVLEQQPPPQQQQQQAPLAWSIVAADVPADMVGVIASSLYNVLSTQNADSAGMQARAQSAVSTVMDTFGVGTATTLVQQVLTRCGNNPWKVVEGGRCAMQLLKAVHSGWLAATQPLLEKLRVSNRLEWLVIQPMLRQQQQEQLNGGEAAAAAASSPMLRPAEGAAEKARGLWTEAEAAAAEGQWEQVVQLVQEVTGLDPSCADSSLYELARQQSGRPLPRVAGLCGALLAAWWGFLQEPAGSSSRQAVQAVINAVVTAAEAYRQQGFLRRGASS